MKIQQIATKNLDLQKGQIVVAQNTKHQGSFPSDIINPKQDIAITLNSGRDIKEETLMKTKEVDELLAPKQVV